MSDTDNLALWSAVEKTPPDQTKKITGKTYQGTSPKPHYLVRKATEAFGPCGIGWGFTVVDERVEDGAGGERAHIARVKVWYDWKGKRGEVEHIGGTQFSGTRQSGKSFTDEDAPKKSVTDALVKALSMLGFAGDIFMGRYDDSKYVNDLRSEANGNGEKTTSGGMTVMHPRTVSDGRQKSAAQAKKDGDADVMKLLDECESFESVSAFERENREVIEAMPPNWQNMAHEKIDEKKEQFKSNTHRKLEESVNIIGAG